ncbi:MAG: metal-dependent hydrolase [Planctomycetota bacterium]
MPTPLGHSLAGLILAKALSPRGEKIPWPLMAGAVLVSLAPDGDNLPVKLYGIDTWHREWTHALAVAPAAGLACALLALPFNRSPVGRAFVLGLLAWVAHIGLDCLSSLTGPKLLLPWSDERFLSPLHLLPVVEPHIGSLFFNAVGVLCETLIFGLPLLALMDRRSTRRGPGWGLAWIFWAMILMGSYRQGEIRMSLFGRDGTQEGAMPWYEKNLDQLTPLHCALFIEAAPPT